MIKTLTGLTVVTIMAFSGPSFAAGSGEHISGSVRHSGQAIADAGAGVVKLASGVVAIPFKMVGAIGTVSDKAGDGMLEFATGTDDSGEKLKITDDAITAGPDPRQAMQKNEASGI